MHIKAWLYGQPIDDFDLDSPDGLNRLVDYLNYHTKHRVSELTELGERAQPERQHDAATT